MTEPTETPKINPHNLLNWLLLAGLLVAGFFCLRTSPKFAANLPQDAVVFSGPALQFLETGYLGANMVMCDDRRPTRPAVPLILASPPAG